MQLLTVKHLGAPRWGTRDVNGDIRLAPPGDRGPQTLQEFIEANSSLGATDTWEKLPPGSPDLMAPIPAPRRNIICLGLNYADHAEESFRAKGKSPVIPEHPVVFTKATTSASGPEDPITLDPTVTVQLDWEVELAVVIGRGGRHITESQAMRHVFGYMVLNDLSARDLQFRHRQFFLGKSLDGCCPMGPWITTRDEIPDPHALRIACRVNGIEKQASNTARMLFRIPAIIATLSHVMSLQPGDIIATGTPAGVGFARTPPEFLKPGDVVECEIEGLGCLRNRITEEP